MTIDARQCLAPWRGLEGPGGRECRGRSRLRGRATADRKDETHGNALVASSDASRRMALTGYAFLSLMMSTDRRLRATRVYYILLFLMRCNVGDSRQPKKTEQFSSPLTFN